MAALNASLVLNANYGYVFGGLFSTILSNVYLVRLPRSWAACPALARQP